MARGPRWRQLYSLVLSQYLASTLTLLDAQNSQTDNCPEPTHPHTQGVMKCRLQGIEATSSPLGQASVRNLSTTSPPADYGENASLSLEIETVDLRNQLDELTEAIFNGFVQTVVDEHLDSDRRVKFRVPNLGDLLR